MPRNVKNNEILYHIGLSMEMIKGAEYVLLPGDPGRVESLAKGIDPNAAYLNFHREYCSYLADYQGHKILVCSTGMGGPSVAIGIEELATIGLKYLIRVGTTGSIQEHINLGDVIINDSAVRLEGTSSHYAPIEYPAVASIELTNVLIDAAKQVSKAPFHIGTALTSDTFYPGQERYDNYTGYVLKRFQNSIQEWRKLNVINMEMETSVVLTMGRVFGLAAAAICGVVAKRTKSEVADAKYFSKENFQNILNRAIHIHLKQRGKIK